MPAHAASNPSAADTSSAQLLRRFRQARERRSLWESHWQACYDYALPLRNLSTSAGRAYNKYRVGEKKRDALFDATAGDAVEQLASSLMAELTPPFLRWFELVPGPDFAGPDILEADRQPLSDRLEKTNKILQHHFDHSNIAVEIHQCFLDLITAGTALLMFEEAEPGAASAFRFTAVPLGESVLEEGVSGRLDINWRLTRTTLENLIARFPDAQPALSAIAHARGDNSQSQGINGDEAQHGLLELVRPTGGETGTAGYDYAAFYCGCSVEPTDSDMIQLAAGQFSETPFIAFRWMKAPGEFYGRSPVMKALPDIKTANKVVELILKNASIAVTGIWQAEDDGVLNPATIQLKPGAIIPKAAGSSGLTPLRPAGDFDVSQLVLQDVRARIRHALLADRLGTVQGERMTATEVLERASEMSRLLGATYGRLQAELMMPLARRAISILRRRGLVPELPIDGKTIDLQVVSPIAMHRKMSEAQGVLRWLDALASLGPAALATIDSQATARFLASRFQVPESCLLPNDQMNPLLAGQNR